MTATSAAVPAAEQAKAGGRFGARVVLLGAAVFLAAVPFTALVLLVRGNWGPLHSLDQGTADRLHSWALGAPTAVTVLEDISNVGGPGPMRALAAVVAVVLLLRHSWRLASWLALTVLLAAILSGGIKMLVGRTRPSFEKRITQAPGASFPSGHSLTSFVVVSLILLVGLPYVARRWWPALIATGTVVVVAIGFSRIALGVHYVSDVLGGWIIGAACVSATTAAFRAWQQDMPTGKAHDEAIAVPPAAT